MAIQPKQQKQTASNSGVGLAPEAFVEGGGLWDDFDGTVLECLFVEWDYNGSIDSPVLALAVEIHNDDEEDTKPEDTNPNPFIQYFSAGDLAHFVPSDDGKEAVPVGSKTGLSKSTNAFAFIMSMIEAGFDKTLISNRVDVFEGAKFHFKREDQPERKGLKDTKKREDGRARQILKAESLIAMPGESQPQQPSKPGTGKPPAGPSKPNTPAKPKPTAPAQAAASSKGPTPAKPQAGKTASPSTTTSHSNGLPDADTQTWAGIYITQTLDDNGGTHPKIGLAKNVVNWAKEQGLEIPVRNKVIQALGNEAFLSQEGLGWTFDGESLSKAE